MKSQDIREKFLAYFKERGHSIFPSSSLVPDDPTLLLTGAGMIQFKPVFQGKKQVDYTRAATVQKCVRTTDIERVGHTARHLTFFEMLGNFSFGDYYKKEAIPWAWDFLTNVLKLNPTSLWITIYQDDDEAFKIWKDDVNLPEERIARLGEEDNFWSAGPTGPCGPCSEIIYDFGEDKSCGPDCQVGCDCDRFLEVWNLVFIQYDRDEAGNLNPLPRKNIDTGMGLERALCIINQAANNFETELLKPILDLVAQRVSVRYGEDEKKDISLKIIADHARAVTFLISDGVLPSNEGRGYILRRLLRRAVRHGRLLGIEDTFLPQLAKKVVGLMGDVYPELKEHQNFVIQIAQNEEERFSQTLGRGLSILSEVIAQIQVKKSNQISGEVAFQLYDTYGFPLELTQEIAEENGLSVDEIGFYNFMDAQKEKARLAAEERFAAESEQIYNEILLRCGKTDFVGYAENSLETMMSAIIQDGQLVKQASAGAEVGIILRRTPFYGESGGQAGDTGLIRTPTGEVKVEETKITVPELYVHRGRVLNGSVEIDQTVTATIDIARRKAIAKNHTATHILHWALRLVLGEHVKQAGSLVEDKRLRFDFTHFSALTPEEIRRVEQLANDKIFENHLVRCYVTSFEFAKDSGAIALFGEKYRDFVRVVEVDEFSKELCGGTHTGSTGEIGLIKIVSEGSIGTNLRRIEALTSQSALNHLTEKEEILEQAAELLRTRPVEMPQKISRLFEELKEKDRELDSLRSKLAQNEIENIIKDVKEINGVKALLVQVEAKDMEGLRSLVDLIRLKIESGVIVLGASADSKAMLVAAVSADLINQGFHAGNLLKEIAPVVEGGGGGRANIAQAGGKKPQNIPQALAEVEEYIKKMRRK